MNPKQASAAPGSLPLELSGFNVSRNDWWIIVTSHLNVLVEGSEAGGIAVVGALKPHLRPPIRYWAGRAPDPPGGTLVVSGVDSLDNNDQRALLEYLAVTRGPRTMQVVSTSTHQLYPRVLRGLFLEELYYRLNTVLLELEEKQ